MFCRKCGFYNDYTIREIDEDGNIISIYYYGKCEKCGKLLGVKEIFRLKECEYLNEEEIKKVLN